MNIIGVNTSAFANFVAPFSPLGKQVVGLESVEAKEDVFTPVEELAETAATLNRRTEELKNNQDQSAEEPAGDAGEQSGPLDDRQLLQELASRDREVRAHEAAHAAVGGQFAGAPRFTFQRGPDGVNYAVGGEVSISLPSSGGDPAATLRAAEQIRQAALAPADPSATDQRIAAQAARVAIEARSDIVAQKAQAQNAQREQAKAEKAQMSAEEQALEEQEREEQAAREERLESLRQAQRRSSQLNEQLITLGNIETEQSAGQIFNELA